jgi:hypothetical protein
MRYRGHFSVNIAGQLVAKDANVSLNTVYDADRKEIFQLSINTLITRDEYSALVQAEMRRRENETDSNS